MKETGVSFAVWAPNAKSCQRSRQLQPLGQFAASDAAAGKFRRLGNFHPRLACGRTLQVRNPQRHHEFFKADPYASLMEAPPETSSIVFKSNHKFRDRAWMTKRQQRKAWQEPLSIYEVHLGSWRRVTEEDGRPLTYREIAPQLAEYVLQNGFTHVEFLPLKEHPYGPSWGYQVSAYFAPVFTLRNAG
jgi:1,4-alpha-glucan branching enzyme